MNPLRQPAAFLPLAMSGAAFALVPIALALHGFDGIRQPDEGLFAHLWQLLMAGQLPIIAYFAIQWLPRSPKQAALVLALQLAAGLAAAAPVFLLHLASDPGVRPVSSSSP